MAGGSVYQQIKHKRITGLVNAKRAVKCFKCGGISTADEMLKGWCFSCYAEWKATADPVMIAQSVAGYAPQSCIPAPTPRQVEQITETIIEPKDDKAFLPLLMFLGNPTLGRMQAMWNMVKTMERLELPTTASVFKLTGASHDTTHRCGLHAPVQNMSLASFLSRMKHAKDFTLLKQDKHLLDYLEWFLEQNRLFIYPLTPISETSPWSRQAWRRPMKWAPLAQHWPFLYEEASQDHDQLLMVDAIVPKGIPEQWRQDMCQDLMVAVLSGEVSAENLKDAAPKYIRQVWQAHPMKYGALSLDAPPPWARDDERTLGQMLVSAVTSHECCDASEAEPLP